MGLIPYATLQQLARHEQSIDARMTLVRGSTASSLVALSATLMGCQAGSPNETIGDHAPVLLAADAAEWSESVHQIQSADGWELHATMTQAEGAGPGVLLIHMCNVGERSDYDTLANRLAGLGLSSLRFDLRGHGQSATPSLDVRRDRDAFWRDENDQLQSDIDSAYAWLVDREDVSDAPVAIVAASCGVRRAIDLARRRPALNTLVLISGQAPADLLPELASGQFRTLVIAAADDGDGIAADWARQIADAAGNAGTLRVLPSGGHGTDLFQSHPELVDQIAHWVMDSLQR